jgi:hypothetical protein
MLWRANETLLGKIPFGDLPLTNLSYGTVERLGVFFANNTA